MGITKDRGTRGKPRQRQWKVNYYEIEVCNGRRIKKRKRRFFTTKPEADAFYHMKALELERFEAGITKIMPKAFDEFVGVMLETHFKHKSYEYQKGSKGPLRKMVAFFKDTPMHQIQPAELQSFLYQSLDEGLSTKTVRNYYGLLSVIYTQAKLRHHIEASPLDHVKPPQWVQRREVTAFTEIELQRILKEIPTELRDVVLLLLHTGMRVGELLRVRVERDVDFEANTVVVRSYEGHETKSRKSRVVPLTPVSREIFAQIRVGPVWTNTYKSLDNKLRRFAKSVGLSNIHCHRFRHTFCSLNMARGVPESVVRSWLGHEGSAITKRYTHLRGLDQQWATLDIGKSAVRDKKVSAL